MYNIVLRRATPPRGRRRGGNFRLESADFRDLFVDVFADIRYHSSMEELKMDAQKKSGKVKAGQYKVGRFLIERDNEPCSGTYRLWNVFEVVNAYTEEKQWCIEFDTLRDAKIWVAEFAETE